MRLFGPYALKAEPGGSTRPMPPTTESTDPQKSGSGQKIDSLKLQLAIVKEHRQELINRLDKLEHQTKENESNYRWNLLALAQLLRVDGNPELEQHLNAFKRLAKNGASHESLKHLLLQLKDATLKQSINAPESKKNKSISPALLKWLRKSDPAETAPAAQQPDASDAISQIKQTYQHIINELRLNLDESVLKKVRKIEQQLNQAADAESFVTIRTSILNLITNYVSKISKEREEAAAFIREIGERLIEVEGQMINSLSFAKDVQQVSSSFTDTIEVQLVDFKQSIDSSRNLSELKSAVVSRLSFIKTVLENKRKDDSTRLELADQQTQKLQQNLHDMKGEIQTAWKRAKALERELLIDPLTGIYNRRAYDRRMEEELQRFQRYHRLFSLLIFDVDNFKRINDLYGHSIGDLCLKEIINRIKPVLRKSDFLARYGGEEFIVIVPETPAEGALEMAEKLRQTVEQTKFIHKSDEVTITVSIGLTQTVPEDLTQDDIFTRADRALYNAKQAGRNRVSAL